MTTFTAFSRLSRHPSVYVILIVTGSCKRTCPNYRTVSKNWIPPMWLCVRGSILKILRKLLRSHEWSDNQTYGTNLTASFVVWTKIFLFFVLWRESILNERFLTRFRRASPNNWIDLNFTHKMTNIKWPYIVRLTIPVLTNFLESTHTKYKIDFYKRRLNFNYEIKFGFSIKIRVGWYVMIKGLKSFC